jgi:antitoxin MazE
VAAMQDDEDRMSEENERREAYSIRTIRFEELIRRLRTFRGRLPDDFKFDRDEANSR